METHLKTNLVSVQLWPSHVELILIKERMVRRYVRMLPSGEVEERALYVRKHLLNKVLQECSIGVVAGWWEAVIICQ